MLLLPSTTYAGAGTNVTLGQHVRVDENQGECELNVTAAATAVGDTLDVYIQTSVDAGVTWDDLIHFTQVLGNGGPKKFLARWQGQIAATAAMAAPQDAALAAGTVVSGPKAFFWRVKSVVVQASAASFTLTVNADVKQVCGTSVLSAYVAPGTAGFTK